ncbi:hypothetical protein IBT54_003647 [Pantoea sp. S62]|nr:hypothetical protein [Pantoea sp. S62]
MSLMLSLYSLMKMILLCAVQGSGVKKVFYNICYPLIILICKRKMGVPVYPMLGKNKERSLPTMSVKSINELLRTYFINAPEFLTKNLTLRPYNVVPDDDHNGDSC